jgi:hypothetical protein
MEVTLSASRVLPSTGVEKEIWRCKSALKEHSPLVFNNLRTGQLYQRPIAGFSARFRPPMKRFASGGKAMLTARLLCYHSGMLYQDRLAAHQRRVVGQEMIKTAILRGIQDPV